MSRTLAKYGLPFDKATPLVHFPKSLKRPWNNADSKALHIGRFNMQFQQDWPKEINYSYSNFWPENSEKVRETDHVGRINENEVE